MGRVIDDISWTDLNPTEQRAIAVLAAGMSSKLCDTFALRTLKRFGLIKGSGLTPRAEEMRRAAILQTLRT
jgi:hypothetical protein